LSDKNRQKPCRSYFRAPSADSADRVLFLHAIFACTTTHLLMLIVFTSFLLFFSLLLWYADKHTKGTEPDRFNDKQNTSRNGTASGFDYFDPNCSQFPLNFPKTSPRGLGYNSPKAGK
jgi:hypothetical protein